jgi:hypothetical protein
MVDDEFWSAVFDRIEVGAIRPEYAYRYWFDELRAVLNEAEARAASQELEETVRELRKLQARCEKVIGVLAPEQRGRPRLVTAAA